MLVLRCLSDITLTDVRRVLYTNFDISNQKKKYDVYMLLSSCVNVIYLGKYHDITLSSYDSYASRHNSNGSNSQES